MSDKKNEMTVFERAADRVTTVSAEAAVKATNALGRLMTTRRGKLMIAVPMAISCLAVTVSAATADSMITSIETVLKTWIPKLGGMLVAVGGIQLAIGFKDDDSTGKTRGMQCMVGGAIVAAIGGAISLT